MLLLKLKWNRINPLAELSYCVWINIQLIVTMRAVGTNQFSSG